MGFSLRDILESIIGGGEQQQAQPSQRVAPAMGQGATRGGMQTPSQRDFPGRTNYGVPQDNMIDTPGGYISREQYDRGLTFGGFPRSNQRQYEDEGFVGNPNALNQYSPLNADVRSFINPMNFNQQQQRNPMNFDSIPNNYTGGRTGYYQGSNPYLQGGNAQDFENRLRVR